MRTLVLILFIFPAISFAQKKDYKNYDKAVVYFHEGKVEKSKKLTEKILSKNSEWIKPNLLMASIYADLGDIEESARYMLYVYDENTPADVLGIEQIAKLYYSNGYYENALYYFNAAQSLNADVLGKKTTLFMQNCIYAIEKINFPVDFNPENLGENINTAAEEYLPAISVNGKVLMITRRVESKNSIIELDNGKVITQEDFYIAEKDDEGKWTKAVSMAINTPLNEGAITISSDGGTLVYTACNRDNGFGSCDLYISVKRNGAYSAGVNIGSVINSKKWESQACFSPDGKYLYFVSNRPGGYGGKDIWRSEITQKGFLPAENLGDTINTKYNEMSPFIHPDNLTFYFASDGQTGFGDYDLFVSRRTSTDKKWGLPNNMGYPINTYNTENSLIVAANGKTAYYASDVSGFGKEDIFQFDLPENLQAEPLADLEMDIITQKAGEEVVLKNVSFASNSFALEQSSFAELDKLIVYLKKNPNLQIEIQGHTDDIGSEIDNQILSKQRAKVVFEYLSTKVNNKLTYKGFGESQPIGDNKEENRRTSFVIKE
ncbi:MAG: OmpA family protein [Flavobacteriales bacterium]|nr:OmpA family protein [Flavobacteriales bacterium]